MDSVTFRIAYLLEKMDDKWRYLPMSPKKIRKRRCESWDSFSHSVHCESGLYLQHCGLLSRRDAPLASTR